MNKSKVSAAPTWGLSLVLLEDLFLVANTIFIEAIMNIKVSNLGGNPRFIDIGF